MPTTTYQDVSAAVAAIQGRTNSGGGAVDDMTAAEMRMYASFFSPGVVGDTAWKVVPGSGLAVNVGTTIDDLAVVKGVDAGQGNYLVRPGGAPPHAITLSAAHVADDRIDQIYIVVQDIQYDGGTVSMARIARRTGDVAASPVAPGPDANWSAFLLLATVLINNGATSIAAGDVTDARTQAGLASSVGLQSSRGPTGVVDMYAGASIPPDSLLCNGQVVSRTTYAKLFAAIGTTWGVGNGTTTFGIPDMRGRAPRGVAASTPGNALGQYHGADTHVHSGPYHSHTNPSTGGVGDHQHWIAHVHSQPSVGTSNPTIGSAIGREGGGSTFEYATMQHQHNTVAYWSGGADNNWSGAAGTHAHPMAATGGGGNENTGSSSTIQASAALNFIIWT
jgi:microcystin-dependent protein